MTKLRGPIGSNVELLLQRQDGNCHLVSLTRAPAPTQEAESQQPRAADERAPELAKLDLKQPTSVPVNADGHHPSAPPKEEGDSPESPPAEPEPARQPPRRELRQPQQPAPSQQAPQRGVGIGLAEKGAGEFFVARLLPGGPAALSGCLRVGDRLLAVEGWHVAGLAKSQVMISRARPRARSLF